MSPKEKLKQSQLGRWYIVHHDAIASLQSETATIDLRDDLGVQDNEAILIWQTRLNFDNGFYGGTFTPGGWNVMRSRFTPYNGAPENNDIIPEMMILAIEQPTPNSAVIQDDFVHKLSDTIQCQPPVLVYQNFLIKIWNDDQVQPHGCITSFLYSVIEIDKITALDIFELARRSAGEAT